MEIVGQDTDIVPLLEVDVPAPVADVDYDPATHRVERGVPVVDVPANQHVHGWDIILLTQEELDEIAAGEEWTQEQIIAAAMYDELKNGVGTQLERLVRTQKVCAHLLKARYNL